MNPARSLALVLLAAAACQRAQASPKPATYPPRWSDQLSLKSLSDVDGEYKRVDPDEFGDLSKGDARTSPQTCEQWADLHRRGYEALSTVDAQGDGYARIRCGTLALLRKVKPAKRGCVRDLPFTDKILSILPASFASAWSDDEADAVAEATKHGKSLRAYDSEVHVLPSKDRGELQIAEAPGKRVSILISPRAWGDFNGDEIDDVALSVINASEGTAAQARLIVLTCSSPKALLSIISSE
ncbi:MAG TPA: hypothetical protein VGI70_15040 [Polyangiales bacterium]